MRHQMRRFNLRLQMMVANLTGNMPLRDLPELCVLRGTLIRRPTLLPSLFVTASGRFLASRSLINHMFVGQLKGFFATTN